MTNSSTKARPFTFATEFTGDGEIVPENDPELRTYTHAEYTAACEAARVEGERSALALSDAALSASLADLVSHLQPVPEVVQVLTDQARREAGELALSLARKIAGKAVDMFEAEALQAVIADARDLLPRGVEGELHVSPALAERLKDGPHALDPALNCRVVADPKVSVGAWVLEWPDGSISHDPDRTEAALTDIVRAHLDTEEDLQADLFAGAA